ncbi:hypothetical protein ASPWEDRAFT_592727 [Aspergillus wentii DTO 134E9]|uniref:Inositol polyphosphate-related phosphatase domain-containing protein n=1 Tax=Aspergillus wentii DTO 134E9 TaxID=1073089 RepID=A0A1L9RD48_ASPWE|nr:uncharacterized protein ASPWEDRAFT_592727 [Aspergillus wentii DTO 134E9]OJJ32787.1 hypothetical protein ASPWEDRAFT_592727 [Aspergillus wentii DTO 134E9]
MEGTGKNKDTDNAPIRPVSSLLSHFEGLAHRRSPSAAPSTPRDSVSFLKSSETGDDTRSSSRASLDLSRPRSPWGQAAESQNGQSLEHSNGDAPPRPSPLPGRRHDRPMSINLRSSPQLGPTLTVDSPRSPPHGFDPVPEQGDDIRFSRSPPNASRESLPAGAVPQVPANRPTTPNFPLPVPAEQKVRHLSPGSSNSISLPREGSDRKTKSVSLPPPVNRADKPKIPMKPPALVKQDTGSLAPRQPPSSDEAVSPFNTPPSSPEKPSPSQRPTARASVLGRSSSRSAEPPVRRSMDERRSPVPAPRPTQDPRELGFSRRRAMPEPTRDTKPLMVQIPQAQSLPSQEPMSGVSISSQKLQTISDSPYDRPGLPPRHPSVRRSGVSPSRQRYADGPANSIASPRHEQASQVPSGIQTPRIQPPQMQRQPSFSRENKPPPTPSYERAPPPPTPSTYERPIPPTPTHERPPPTSSYDRAPPPLPEIETDEQNMDEPAISRTDYPDSSNASRRPPVIKTGPNEIWTRYDTRLMDVCGKYVCTTGYLTRVWDLTTGEQIMSLSHGETVKSLSLAFKPGKGLEDEGQRLWLGMSSGDLHEVDISTRSIITSRSYPSRREVVKILRHKKEMWTVDDEGRLLVWPPDETGTPNLQYSYHNPYDRVARNQTFSMVVKDKLWLAAGKEVHVYRPNARDDTSFKVLKRPLGLQHSGDVTSGAYTSKDGGRVYLGHADGKVTVYSAVDYACLAVINVSVYKINCLGIVGDYLWAAYKTGMIYVYDTTTNPWTVKKDWRAHDSPVCSFLLDTSSVWTMNRLQVTSLGTDNCIRLWDGMLEDDWLEMRMQHRDVEWCKFREIHTVIMTWNAGASTPGSVRTSNFIQDAIHPENPPEVLVFGFQELVDLENKKITAKSLLMSSKKKEKKEHGEKEHMSRQYRVWIEHLTQCINDCMPLEESYVLLHTSNMVGLFTCIFVKHKERHRIKNVNAAEVKRGMGGLHGNKGALLLRFVLDDSSLCFVNCHLAAGQTQTAHRNNDIAAILEAEPFPAENNLLARSDNFVSGGDGSMIMDHEVCILNGDFNYRIDSIPRNVIIDAVKNNNLPKLLERDQLLASKRKNPGFRLRAFNEAPILFAPTYKYDVGTDNYDSSEKKRSPAWCDRVLYRGLGRIKQLEYRRHEVRASDHRPVSASFKVRIKTVAPQERAVAWEKCQQEFQKEKRRLASDASIEYLINVLGTDPNQARALILGNGQ